MFDISLVQVGLLLGAGVFVLGPSELPVVSRFAGRACGRAVRFVLDARKQWEEIAKETSELNEVCFPLRDHSL